MTSAAVDSVENLLSVVAAIVFGWLIFRQILRGPDQEPPDDQLPYSPV